MKTLLLVLGFLFLIGALEGISSALHRIGDHLFAIREELRKR